MIYTVTGTVKKEELGATLAHEHLHWSEGDTVDLYFNKKYDDEKLRGNYEILLPTFKELYNLGCRTIVEASPPVGGQNLKLMNRLSRESGIKIIANTGMAFENSVYEIHKDFKEEELAKRWVGDFKNGLDTIDGIKVVPNQIKLLLGNDHEKGLSKIDEKILKGAIMASKKTGMKIHCHIFQSEKLLHAIKIMEDESFDYGNFLWAHACREGNLKVIEEAFNRGVWLGFDCIRSDKYEYYYKLIKEALSRGYKDKLMLSQDYDFYDEIMESGENNPCGNFFKEFMEYCQERGLSKGIIEEIITKNPGEFLDI